MNRETQLCFSLACQLACLPPGTLFPAHCLLLALCLMELAGSGSRNGGGGGTRLLKEMAGEKGDIELGIESRKGRIEIGVGHKSGNDRGIKRK